MQLRTAVRHFEEGYFSTRDRSEKTKAAYGYDLLQFCDFIGRRKRLPGIRADALETWAAHLRAKGYAPASIGRKMAALRIFFRYWVRRGRLESSPFWQVRMSLGHRKQLPRCLAEQQVWRLLRHARRVARQRPSGSNRGFLARRNLALVDLLFNTGIRVGEAVSLNLESFLPEERAYRIRGKGGRMRLAFLTEKKSLRVQREYLAARRGVEARTTALFPNRFGMRLSPQGAANAISKLGRQASLDTHVTPHMLRHTVATLLLRNGVDLRVVQEFLGHASITSTQRYTHVSKEQMIRVLEMHHPAKRARLRA